MLLDPSPCQKLPHTFSDPLERDVLLDGSDVVFGAMEGKTKRGRPRREWLDDVTRKLYILKMKSQYRDAWIVKYALDAIERRTHGTLDGWMDGWTSLTSFRYLICTDKISVLFTVTLPALR